jgi:hypothetical protein
MHFACPQLLTSADLEAAMTTEPVHEETTRESLPLLRTSCPAGAPGPIALPRAPQLLNQCASLCRDYLARRASLDR